MRKALLLTVLILVPSSVLAQPHRFEVSPVVGYRFDSDFDTDDGLFDERNVQVDEGTMFGLIFDVPLNPFMQLEFIANRQNTRFTADPGLFTPERDLGDVTIDLFHAGILIQWSPGQVVGFFSTGLGIGHIDPDLPDLESETRFSGNFGGGVKIFLAENIGLRLDGRFYWVDLGSFDDHDHHHDDDFDSNGLFQGEASAGLIFSW